MNNVTIAKDHLESARVAYNTKASTVEANMGIIASNLAIAESNEALSLATTQSSLNIANAIAKLNIEGLIESNREIAVAIRELIEVLKPAPVEPIVEPIVEPT